MNKGQVIAHTKNYMDMLAQGIDPIKGEKITEDCVILSPRMQKCFAFVAEVFDELLKNNGFVALDPRDKNRFEIIEKKVSFSLSKEQMENIPVSSKPITPHVFLSNVNRVIDAKRMEKLSVRSINAWLLSKGYIEETKVPSTIHRTIRKPSEKSKEIGIHDQEIIDAKTGEIKLQMMFSLQTQAYLLAHIAEIAACGK